MSNIKDNWRKKIDIFMLLRMCVCDLSTIHFIETSSQFSRYEHMTTVVHVWSGDTITHIVLCMCMCVSVCLRSV